MHTSRLGAIVEQAKLRQAICHRYLPRQRSVRLGAFQNGAMVGATSIAIIELTHEEAACLMQALRMYGTRRGIIVDRVMR